MSNPPHTMPTTPDSGASIFFRAYAAALGFTTNFNQGVILQNLSKYLRKEGRDENLIKKFEQGYCSGISSVWLYSKWLETQPKDQTSPNKPRDDYEWFRATSKLVADWDRKKALTKEEAADFERFISYIEYFQNIEAYQTTAQGNLDESLEDTKKRGLTREYSIASLFTLKQLKKLLRRDELIQNGKSILISSHNHDTALFRQGNAYYYFDPNSETGEIQKASTDEVAELIFQANSFSASKPSPLAFRFFTMGEPSKSYKPVKEVLDDIEPALTGQKGYANSATGLITAARHVGCLDSVKYFLTKNKSLPIEEQKKQNELALHLAAFFGHTEIVKELLQATVKPDLTYDKEPIIVTATKKGRTKTVAALATIFATDSKDKLDMRDSQEMTALMWAAKLGHIEIVRDLLNNGADLNLKNPNKQSAIILAALAGHTEIVEELLKKADPQDCRTALVMAAANEHIDTFNTLLAQLDPLDKHTQAAIINSFIFAAKNGHIKSVENILAKVAELNDKLTTENKIDLAHYAPETLIATTKARHTNMVKFLLENPILQNKPREIQGKDEKGRTPLMIAVTTNDIKTIAMLLDPKFNIDLNARDVDGDTAVMLALKAKNYAIAAKLLKNPSAHIPDRAETQRKLFDLNNTSRFNIFGVVTKAANTLRALYFVRSQTKQRKATEGQEAKIEKKENLVVTNTEPQKDTVFSSHEHVLKQLAAAPASKNVKKTVALPIIEPQKKIKEPATTKPKKSKESEEPALARRFTI